MSDELAQLKAALAHRYDVERELGRGGMAVVYLARDLKHDRPVALKVLRPELAASLGAERFLREIQITARLTHPHVLMLIDSGDADGTLYYVMPYVDGLSLRDRLNVEKQLPIDDAIRITREVADALAYAHDNGVIHRDVKPENILFESDHAVVSDFGIGRAISEAGGDRLTETGLAVGTPAYMSPEQATGEAALDARSDIYSLGCVLYEMLAGDAPFTGSSPQAILARKVTDTVPSVKTVRSTVPDTVVAALDRALARVPADRYATAQAFASALTVSRRRTRHVVVPVVAAIVIGLIAVFLALGGRFSWIVRPAAADFFDARDRVLVADFTNETNQPALGLAIREAVETDLDQSSYANVVERTGLGEVMERMLLPDSTAVVADVAVEIARREGYRAVISGGVRPLGNGYQLTAQIIEPATAEVAIRLQQTANDDDDVLDAVERLARLTRRHLGESLRDLGRSRPLPQVTTASLDALELSARATELGQRGRIEEAISLLLQAVEIDSTFASAYRGLGIYYGNMGSTGAAQSNISKAYRHSDRLSPRERYLIGSAFHAFRGRLDSAAYYYSLLVNRYPTHSTGLNNLGDVYERMGRYEEALELYRRSAASGQGIVPLLNLASAARTLGQHALADSVLTAMLEQFPNTWMTWQTQAGNALYAVDFDRLEVIANDMARHALPFPRTYGRWILASMSGMRGQLGRAIALADSATVLATESSSQWFQYLPLLVAQYSALAAGLPDRMLPVVERAPDPGTLGTSPYFHHLTLGFVANGYALAGEGANARRVLATMDSLVETEDFQPSGIADHVRAVLALAGGNAQDALAHLVEAREKEQGLLHHLSKLLLADTFAALGRWADAAVHYDSVVGTYRLNYTDVGEYGPILPLAHERAGAAYLALGDTATAVEHLNAFVNLWRDADPELQPIVRRARSRLADLVGESR